VKKTLKKRFVVVVREGESRREKAQSFGGNGDSKDLLCGGNEESERRGVQRV